MKISPPPLPTRNFIYFNLQLKKKSYITSIWPCLRNDVTAVAWKSILKGANYDGFVSGTKIYTKRGTKATATTDFYALKPTQVDIRVSIEKIIYLFILFVFCVELSNSKIADHDVKHQLYNHFIFYCL